MITAIYIVSIWFAVASIGAVIFGRAVHLRDLNETPSRSVADEAEDYLREIAA